MTGFAGDVARFGPDSLPRVLGVFPSPSHHLVSRVGEPLLGALLRADYVSDASPPVRFVLCQAVRFPDDAHVVPQEVHAGERAVPIADDRLGAWRGEPFGVHRDAGHRLQRRLAVRVGKIHHTGRALCAWPSGAVGQYPVEFR